MLFSVLPVAPVVVGAKLNVGDVTVAVAPPPPSDVPPNDVPVLVLGVAVDDDALPTPPKLKVGATNGDDVLPEPKSNFGNAA